MNPPNLHFDMGEFHAEFPTDRMYAPNHMWAKQSGGVWRFGFTMYAVRLLQDVYFLDWIVEEGTALAEKQEFGQIESKKAEASLYSPAAGRITHFNAVLLKDPSAINVDTYATGWLFELASENSTEPTFLSPADYLAHLSAVWEVTQRTIKGQLNE